MTRALALVFLSVAVLTACAEDGDLATPAPTPEDLADPMFLPVGTYAIESTRVDCDDRYQDFERDRPWLLDRIGATTNVPLPISLSAPASSGYPRQDIELDQSDREWTHTTDPWCPGGEVTTRIGVVELTATRFALRYEEDRRGCDHVVAPRCVIDFSYSLLETICGAPAEDGCRDRRALRDVWRPDDDIGFAVSTRTIECACEP